MTDHNDHHAIDISINAKSQRSQNMSALESINETREVWCFGGEKLKLLHVCLAALPWLLIKNITIVGFQCKRDMKYKQIQFFFLSFFFSQLQVWHGGNLSPIQTEGREFWISCGCDQKKYQNFFCYEKLNLQQPSTKYFYTYFVSTCHRFCGPLC